MASPQVENGFTRIANELLERLLASCLSPNEWRVLLCIVRLSYGFRTKTARITGARVASMTGIAPQNVSTALRRLAERNMIVRAGKQMGLQKDWERWQTAEQTSLASITSEHGLDDAEPKSNRRLLPKVIGGYEELNALKKRIKKEEVAPLCASSSEGEARKPLILGDEPTLTSPATRGNGRVNNAEVRRIFAGLKERRGWPSPKAAAEAKAVRWMLANGYTVDDILGCFGHLSGKDFWRDKPLYAMSVQKEIGAWKQRQTSQPEDIEWRVR